MKSSLGRFYGLSKPRTRRGAPAYIGYGACNETAAGSIAQIVLYGSKRRMLNWLFGP
jgi:hypothetical protein